MKQKLLMASILLVLLLSIAACSNGQFSERDYWGYRNVKYGNRSSSQTIDMYFPSNLGSQETISGILLIHGGGWEGGDKNSYTGFCKTIAKAGLASATMNYRLTGDRAYESYESMLDDITSALEVFKKKAAENGLTLDKIALMGHSAGGHLSMLYSYTRTPENPSPVPISFCISSAGPSDLSEETFNALPDAGSKNYATRVISRLIKRPDLTSLDHILENSEAKEVLAACSPITYASSTTTPTIFAHGKEDTVVPYSSALRLYTSLKGFGVTSEFISFEHSGHGLEGDNEKTQKLYRTMEEFAESFNFSFKK